MDRIKFIGVITIAFLAANEVTCGQSRSNRGHRTTCITSCVGRGTGHYASCLGCEFYATCAHGLMYDGIECDDGKLWDDKKKTCDWAFYVTCSEGSFRPPDIPEAEPGMDQDREDENDQFEFIKPTSTPESEESGESTTRPKVNNLNSDEASAATTDQSDFDRCLIWIILCFIAVGLLFLLSLYHFAYVRYGYMCKKDKSKMADAYTQMSFRSLSITSSAPSYDDVIAGSDESQRYVPLPYAVSSDNPTYQEIFPIYEELNDYRDRYLTLHGYTYLQLVQHVGNDVTRREIARSVGPLYLTLCHQHNTSPKAYEYTQDRMRALVNDLWREIPSGNVETLRKKFDSK